MTRPLSAEEREHLLLDLLHAVHEDTLDAGTLLRRLRKEVLRMNQDDYASLVGVSRRTLSQIEGNEGNQTQAVLNRVFKPLGLKMELVPRSMQVLDKLLRLRDEGNPVE